MTKYLIHILAKSKYYKPKKISPANKHCIDIHDKT